MPLDPSHTSARVPPPCRMFLGTDIGWVDVMEYHDADQSCTISMPELETVCRAHFDACTRFLDSSHTTVDGSVGCRDTDMMSRMMKGGDVCCDYTDGRNCGTFPVGGPQDSAEECADTGVVDTTSLSLRMPLNRDCIYWVAALRFPGVVLPPATVIDEAYIIFPVRSLSDQSTPVSLRIFVEGADSSAPLTADAASITSRPSLNAVVNWTPDHWAPDATKPVQMSVNIGTLIAQLTSRPGWNPGNAILVKIEPATSNGHTGQRIALAYDENKMLPAVRIVYHTDETIANSIQAYHADVTAIETARAVANEDSWSNGEIFFLMVLVAACVGVVMRQYNRKYGRQAGATYGKVAIDEEARGIMRGDDYDDEFDSEGSSGTVATPRDRYGNPVARAFLSEGAKASASQFVFRDQKGSVK